MRPCKLALPIGFLGACCMVVAQTGTVLLDVNVTTPAVSGLLPTFLSVNIDTASIAEGVDFADPVLANLLLHVSPALLRIGGSAANGLRFTDSPGMPCGYAPGRPGVELSTSCWDSINHLLSYANAIMLFDFSAAWVWQRGEVRESCRWSFERDHSHTAAEL